MNSESTSCKNGGYQYDFEFFFSTEIDDNWSDPEQATEYLKELAENCWADDSSKKTPSDLLNCYHGGSRWSTVWKFNAITVLLIALANILMIVGAYKFHARAAASCCLCLLGCTNIAAIITTGVFRFNTVGKLAALSTLPVKYNYTSGTEVVFDYGRTFQSDATTILALWITGIGLCCCNCVLASLLKPKQEEP